MLKKPVWGLLYPLKDTFQSVEFKKDDYTVGKDAACSYVIKDSQLSKTDYNLLSKKQFKISRKRDAVYLEDVGGTYVNDKKVGPGQKTILNHNDRIAISKSHLKVFVYLDKSRCDEESRVFPAEISQKYLVSYPLGEGGFGEVSLIFEKSTGRRFAMKTVKKQPKLLRYIYTETKILQEISHPCVINTEEVVDTHSVLFFVLEFMEGGDLLRRVFPYNSLKEADMKLIFFQLAQAIEYLHQKSIVHRDIKPENILLASKENETLIKVADFGVSKILTPGTKMDTHVGTPLYTAPEILNNTHEVYTKQVDIWSMGIVLYFCLSSQKPFGGKEDMKRAVVQFPPLFWSKISSSVTDLIKGMLKSSPTQRLRIEQVLAHQWLKDQPMRRKAHYFMWPQKPYVGEQTAPSFQRGGSLRQQPRGVLQYMSPKGGQTMRLPNRAPQRPGIGADRYRMMSPVAKQPALGNSVYGVNRPLPNAARVPYKPAVGPSVQNSVQFRPLNGAGVRYEAVKPVKDAVRAFEKKN